MIGTEMILRGRERPSERISCIEIQEGTGRALFRVEGAKYQTHVSIQLAPGKPQKN